MTDTQLNPNDFIIARKRKKYRFALFSNAENCFEFQEWPRTHLPNLTVELGAGTALFSVELAHRHPDRNFIAIDVKADRLQKGAARAIELGLKNIWFVRARADQLSELFDEGSIEEIWLTFSDPFPRISDAKRRLTAPRFLTMYSKILRKNGVVRQKTDSHALFDWSLEQYVSNRWSIQEVSYDLHDSALSDDYKILTTYEEKWLHEGLTTYYVAAMVPK